MSEEVPKSELNNLLENPNNTKPILQQEAQNDSANRAQRLLVLFEIFQHYIDKLPDNYIKVRNDMHYFDDPFVSYCC